MTKNGASVSEDSFVFNLGRLWEVAILEHWDDAVYLYEFIQEITFGTTRFIFMSLFKKSPRPQSKRDSQKN